MESKERTPLIATVVTSSRPLHRRSFWRRFSNVTCTAAVVVVVMLLNYYDRHGSPRQSRADAVPYSELQEILLTTPKEEKAEEWSRYYTSGPHLAGKNYSQAVWTVDRWKEFGIAQTTITAYETYLNYPLGHRLALYEKGGDGGNAWGGLPVVDKAHSWKVVFEARLEEDVLDQDPTTALEDRIPTFHGYSASGNVTAQYVYANYGTYQDFEDLVKANISLGGKIAIVRYGLIFRGLKVKRAQELGMVGVVIYSDPGDDGEHTDEHGDNPYPDGPARNPTSVQRGSTQFLSFLPGDP
jgi:N-acetylated-alpha-linked acidic dipeptidase